LHLPPTSPSKNYAPGGGPLSLPPINHHPHAKVKNNKAPHAFIPIIIQIIIIKAVNYEKTNST
jgi:hypothetical protein